MRILSVTAQKPHATGSGVYLSETVREFAAMGHAVAVCAGVTHEDRVTLPDCCRFYPVYYETTALPFPVCGMSDEMPYKSTRYRDMSDAMTAQFRAEWTRTLREAVADFRPELILCHHLYLLSALVRELFPDIPVCALCHGSDLRQLRSNALCREEILLGVRALERVFCLHEVQQREIAGFFRCRRISSA